MKNIPLFGTDFSRRVALTPHVMLKNRFYEKNPIENDTDVTVLSRPAMKLLTTVGVGPIRGFGQFPGTFDGDLFVVSGLDLFRVSSTDLSATDVGTIGTSEIGDVSMCATASIGTVPAYLYIADGNVLWIYTDNGHATGHLEASGAIANNDTISVNGVYYKWTTGSVDSGTPAGTAGSPWLVALGSGNATAMTNMNAAVNATGTAGTDYSTALIANTTVQATNFNSTDFFVQAIDAGIVGNSYALTETGANLAWTGATMAGGGSAQLRQVQMPDDIGAISVAHINSYVIVVPVQGDDNKGQFFWINPGETVVNPLNWATAERNPDGINQVIVFGDMFWLLGQNTTEPWNTTGDPAAPMERFRGILFDRGTWAGTAVQVKDSLILIDENGRAFQIKNGLKDISRPDITERIRRAQALSAAYDLAHPAV